MFSGQHDGVHRSNYLETQSSTNASDVQESDDNFWVEQVRIASVFGNLQYMCNGHCFSRWQFEVIFLSVHFCVLVCHAFT